MSKRKKTVTVTLRVTVHVDPAADELLEMVDKFRNSSSIPEIVRFEIESNLESVSYVRGVSVEHLKEVNL